MVLNNEKFASIAFAGLSILLLLLTGCEPSQQSDVKDKANFGGPALPANMPVLQRWYTQEQVGRGHKIYQVNCASCHKQDASGTKDWQTPLENGKYPPPPINGNAHAWHHPLNILRRVVNQGGIPLGGSMPAFEDKLGKQDVDDVLAWVQSNWSDEIYKLWYERNQQSR